jgi:RNAse (barnase) inhibitor barstar
MFGAEFLRSAVNLYFKPDVLDRDTAALRDAGYRIVTVDASAWVNVSEMHRDLAQAFDFPAHYGRNWSALDDCLGDVRALYWDLPPGTLRLVFVLRRFDVFAATRPDDAHLLLDIYARNQRDALIGGDHMICLVQSDNPSLQLAPVGATAAQWNRDEWLDRNRGV